jgi:hypothetical protein
MPTILACVAAFLNVRALLLAIRLSRVTAEVAPAAPCTHTTEGPRPAFLGIGQGQPFLAMPVNPFALMRTRAHTHAHK